MASRGRILILTSGPLCRNPRVLKEATALSEAGFDTTVMTIANLARFEAFDDEIMRTATFKKIVLDQVSPRWSIRSRSTLSRLGTWLARRASRWGIDSAQSLGPARTLSAMAARFPADLIIVHTELPFVIGARLLARGRRVAADIEDWHSQDLLPDARATRPNRLITHAEKTLLRGGTYTSTTSHAMSRALQQFADSKAPIAIANAFPLQPARPQRAPGDPLSFFWFSQTIGPGRGLEPFIDAWGRTTQPSRLCVLGDVNGGYCDFLRAHIPNPKRSLIQFLPIVAPSELPAVVARHTIGLALEPTQPANKNLTISNKILQYFNAGLAVLASDTAGQREALDHAPGAGCMIALDKVEALARQLDALLSSPDRIATMGAAARRAAEQTYCWEREAPRLISAVVCALGSPAASAP